mgnify:CR=1 FL=1
MSPRRRTRRAKLRGPIEKNNCCECYDDYCHEWPCAEQGGYRHLAEFAPAHIAYCGDGRLYAVDDVFPELRGFWTFALGDAG